MVLGEPLQQWKLAAFALVMAGLVVGVLWPRLTGKVRA
jgi:O-acetylserine/cysteine efflux transporter